MSYLSLELIMAALLVAGYFWWRHEEKAAKRELMDRVVEASVRVPFVPLGRCCARCDEPLINAGAALLPAGVTTVPFGPDVSMIVEDYVCMPCFRQAVAA